LQKNMRVQAHGGTSMTGEFPPLRRLPRGFRRMCARLAKTPCQQSTCDTLFQKSLIKILTAVAASSALCRVHCRRIGDVSAESLSDLRVLLVDDNGSVRTLTRQMLRRLSVTSIREADDGDSAVAIFCATPMSFDLIICDWNMPSLSGMEVCRQVRAERPDMPFLLVTGRADAESVIMAKEAGVSAYISKPFAPQELKLKVSAIVERLNRTRRTA
jgi:two-component system chemotaxis response regulator CheY